MVLKRTATRRRKPAYRRRRRFFKKRGRPTTTIVRAPSAFSDRTLVKLNYVDLIPVTTAGFSTLVYRGNDLYDPYYAVGGHQPMGFDQYMGIYNRFTVMASKILVWGGTATGHPQTLSVRPVNSASATTYLYEALERPRTKFSHYSHYIKMTPIRHYSTTARQLGEKKSAILAEENYSGTASASPVNVWYWHVGVNADTTQSVSVYVWIKLTYYCMFHDRKPLGLS